MAIVWSGFKKLPGYNVQIGIDVVTSEVTTSSPSVTFTFKTYTQFSTTGSAHRIAFAGSGGSGAAVVPPFAASQSVTLQATRTHTYTYGADEFGSSPGTRKFTATLQSTSGTDLTSFSVTVPIPARPVSTPNAITGATVTRVDNSQQNLAWTNNKTDQRPYKSILVYRRILMEGGTWSDRQLLATLGHSATTYSDRTTKGNSVYRYQLRPSNAAGAGDFTTVSPSQIATGGGGWQPSNLKLTRIADGSQMRVSWKNNAYPNLGIAVTFTIDRKVDTGSFVNVATGVSANQWVDTSPPLGVLKYRVRVVYQSMSSTWVETETAAAPVAPLAPTFLAPVTAVDPDEVIRIEWQHNHGGDYMGQTTFWWEYSTDNGATWSGTGAVTSTDSFYNLPASTLTGFVGSTILHRLRTRSSTTVVWGPRNDPAPLVLSSRPTVTISGPAATVTAFPVTLDWSYVQGESEPQTEFEVTVTDSAGGVVEVINRSSDAETVRLDSRFIDEDTFTVSVRARSAQGLWSVPASRTFTVDLLPPAMPILDALYHPAAGAVVVDVSAEAPDYETTDPIDHIDIERNAGTGWEPFASNIKMASDMSPMITESFEEDDGGWKSNSIFNEYGPDVTRVSSDAPLVYPVPDGTHYLRVTWATPDPTKSGQNILYYLTGLTVGKSYTVVMNVLNTSTVDLTFAVVTQSAGPAVPVVAGWQTVVRTFVASGNFRFVGLRTPSPVAGQSVFIDKVAIYEGELPGYAEDITTPTSLVDPIPAVVGVTQYRATAVSRNGAIVRSQPVEVVGTNEKPGNQWVFLAYGEGFNQVLRFRGDPSVNAVVRRKRGIVERLKAGFGLALMGKQTGRVLNVSGTLVFDPACDGDVDCMCCSLPAEWEQASLDAETVCLRDYTGRRVFGVMGEDVAAEAVRPHYGTVDFEIHQTDYSPSAGTVDGQTVEDDGEGDE